MKSTMRTLYVLVIVFALLCGATTAMGATTTPSAVNAAYGQSTTVVLHYLLPTTLPSFTSNFGTFCIPTMASCAPITGGTVNLTLTTTTQRVSEVLTIPQAVVERVLKAGYSSFNYTRYFLGGGDYTLTINITPGSAAAFSLKRIELYFDNLQKKNEMMVQRNFRGLKAYTDIYYNGSGFLNGYWEVDGLVIERVNRFVPSGGKVTLSTPNVPDLPTFDPGYHIVKFIVTNPETSFEVPEMVYWVKGAEEPVKQVLALLKPPDGMDVPPDFPFTWERMDKAAVYRISFIKPEDKTVRFSALTRDTSYRIPASVLAEYLSPAGKYLWAVKSFDTESNVIAESGLQSFYFKKPANP